MDSIPRTQPHVAGPAPHPAPCGHLVQFYADHNRLLDTLEGYISAGLYSGEAVVVIATPPHLHALEARLQGRGIDLVTARNENRYLPFGAHDAMDRFMVDGRPDAGRFTAFVDETVARARGPGRKVRAFGEMVAVLWAAGQREAALQLEQLWCDACARGALALLCAYPTSGFSGGDDPELERVRALHTGEATEG